MNKPLTTHGACGSWTLERNDKQYTFTFTHTPKYPTSPLALLSGLKIYMQTTYCDHLIYQTPTAVDYLHRYLDNVCKHIPMGIVESWVWDCLKPLGVITLESSIVYWAAQSSEHRKFFMPRFDTLMVVGPELGNL